MYYGRLLRQIAEAMRNLAADIQGGIEKISSKIDSAASAYKSEKEEKQRAASQPLTATLSRSKAEIEQEEARESHKERREANRDLLEGRRFTWERAGFWVTLALAIFNAGVLGIYILQLHEMRSSNEISRQSLQSVQRAFMNFDNIDPHFPKVTNVPNKEKFPPNAYGAFFGAYFVNEGTTPANNVVPSLSVERLDGEPDEAQFIGSNIMPLHTYVGPKGHIMIGPKGMPLHESGLDTPPTALGPQLYVWGWVAYDDVFPHTKRHLTEFCQSFRRASTTDKAGAFMALASNCQKHNCADEYCPDYAQIIAANP